MKHKVSELEGALLDAAVAKAAGMILVFENSDRLDPTVNELDGRYCKPSTDWRIGGRIIESERIACYFEQFPAQRERPWVAGFNLEVEEGHDWGGETGSDSSTISLDYASTGPTPLIAAMRAYVASKFGDKVELP